MQIDIEQVFDQYAQEIYWLAYTYVRDFSIAEDIMQETFLKVYKHNGRFKWKSSLKTWIFSIARNLCKDNLKSAYHNKVNVSDHSEVIVDFNTPESTYMNAEKRSEIVEMVFNLPEKYKEVIILYYFSGLSMNEIAKTMSTNINTIKTRLKRAKELLKNQFEEGNLDEGR